MAFKKSVVFVMCCVIVAAIVAAPIAEAQLGLISGLLGLIRIQGTIFCTANGGMGVNGTSTPVFPNALVQVQCANGNVVSGATTNSSGAFSILLDPLTMLLSSLLQDCRLVVATPLSNCNASLPSVGGLISSIQMLGTTLIGLLNITNLIPAGFIFNRNLNV